MNEVMIVEGKTPQETIENFNATKVYLREQVESVVSQTRNLVVTDETLGAAKKQHAEINKLIKSLSSTRNGVKKELLEQFNDMEATIKDLEKDLKEANTELNGQLNTYKQKELDERRQHVTELVTEIAPQYGVQPSEFLVTDDFISSKKTEKRLVEMVVDGLKVIQGWHKTDDMAEQLLLLEAQKRGLDPQTYLDQYDNQERETKDTEVIVKRMDVDLMNLERQRQAEFESLQTETYGDKVINTSTGEIEQTRTVQYTVTGTPAQLEAIEKFIKQTGAELNG